LGDRWEAAKGVTLLLDKHQQDFSADDVNSVQRVDH
jgi:hypothetical protein